MSLSGLLLMVYMQPIVVHGAGPQLNAELERRGVQKEYINGQRITTPEILSIANRVFQRENLNLVNVWYHFSYYKFHLLIPLPGSRAAECSCATHPSWRLPGHQDV